MLAHETNLEFNRRADCLIIYLFVFYIPCTEKVHNLLRMWPKSNGVNVLNTVWADLAGYCIQLEELLNSCWKRQPGFIWCNSARHHLITKYLSSLFTAQEATFALPLFFQCLGSNRTRENIRKLADCCCLLIWPLLGLPTCLEFDAVPPEPQIGDSTVPCCRPCQCTATMCYNT